MQKEHEVAHRSILAGCTTVAISSILERRRYANGCIAVDEPTSARAGHESTATMTACASC